MKEVTHLAQVVLFIAASSLLTPLLSQTVTRKPSFDVASVKPSAPGVTAFRGGGPRANGFVMDGATLRMLLQFAYSPTNVDSRVATPMLLNNQIIGGPSWIDSERFDVQAKVERNTAVSSDQLRLMVQSLLEVRFQLKVHQEMRELPIYNLVI